MTRVLLAIVALAAGLAPAIAQNRPDTRTYTCAQVNALVKHYMAAVLTTGPHTYLRVVSQGSLCGPQTPKLVVAPTLDNPRCRIGYRCQEKFD